jgi:nitroreductase/ketosteroid isomerase-like protein
MTRRTALVSAAIPLLVLGLSQGAQGAPHPLSLRETFDLYVKSVQSGDLAGLFSTVTSNEQPFFFVTSQGTLIDSRAGYRKFHEEWFKETGWEMPVELVQLHEGRDAGWALATFHYKADLGQGKDYLLDSYFLLLFAKEEGRWKVVGDLCAPIRRTFGEGKGTVRYTPDQRFLFDTMAKRRTVRSFRPDPVPEAHILKILDAARRAPTAGNQQPWTFLVVRDRARLDQLREEALGWYLEGLEDRSHPDPANLEETRAKLRDVLTAVLSAPVYLAVLVDTQAKYPEYVVQDGALAAGYLMIAARALGYGTGYFTTFFPSEKMKAFLTIPDRYRLMCFTPIGIPSEWPQAPEKKDLNEFVVWDHF